MSAFVLLPTAPHSLAGTMEAVPPRAVLVNIDRIMTVESSPTIEGWSLVAIAGRKKKLGVPNSFGTTCALIRQAAGEPVVPIRSMTVNMERTDAATRGARVEPRQA